MRLLCSFLMVFLLAGCSSNPDKTVLIAILARNKAHTLPKYLDCIERLDYNKRSITIYINTNNNQDETEAILTMWVEKNREAYRKIILDCHEVDELASDTTNPHEWTTTRFSVLGKIRQDSMEKTLEEGCDYYFVADCDNFVAPSTLKTLVAKNRPIIAPMLETLPAPQTYSNFFCDTDPNGYWKASPFYYEILSRNMLGTFPVPVVHCTYLIRADQISKLAYLDGTGDFEFVIFSRSARNQGIQQYICNEEHFGYLFLPTNSPELGKIDLDREISIFTNLDIPSH